MIPEHQHESSIHQESILPFFHNLALMFDWISERMGTRPALVYPEHTISFLELSQIQRKLASLLSLRGLGIGDRLAIVSNKSYLSYALMLACLRIGVSYVNLDSAAPTDRNIKILESSHVRIVFVESPSDADSLQSSADLADISVLHLSEELLQSQETVHDSVSALSPVGVDGATVAYVMFTSGSTGTPKGVAISHQSVLHFISWIRSRFQVSPEDRVSGLNPLHFDNSVFDFFGSIFLGAALVPVRRERVSHPAALMQQLQELRCNIWFSVPSLLIYLNTVKALNTQNLSNLRLIIFGGEGYPKPELLKLWNLAPSAARLVNVYGPTECTCICSSYEIQSNDFEVLDGLPPLGSVNQNIDYLILDESGVEGSIGELCLIGDNVALGYINDPERTATSFSTMAIHNRFGKRMYRTGDIVEIRDGILRFVGRKDNQIKHMGYRIELEEIELALASHPAVIQAAALYIRTNSNFGKIIAFVSARTESLSERSALDFVRKRLPSYMVPSRVVVLSDLPKNQNGKIDRISLAQSFRRDS